MEALLAWACPDGLHAARLFGLLVECDEVFVYPDESLEGEYGGF
jgi:hypothetical protein